MNQSPIHREQLPEMRTYLNQDCNSLLTGSIKKIVIHSRSIEIDAADKISAMMADSVTEDCDVWTRENSTGDKSEGDSDTNGTDTESVVKCSATWTLGDADSSTLDGDLVTIGAENESVDSSTQEMTVSVEDLLHLAKLGELTTVIQISLLANGANDEIRAKTGNSVVRSDGGPCLPLINGTEGRISQKSYLKRRWYIRQPTH
uniref:Uncharacterized protein n=1 Tax=Romanomermis culicivorax TaxID=13658 RepID=A0A915HYW8_ROMCU